MRSPAPDTTNVIPFPRRCGNVPEPGFIRLEWWVPADWKDHLEDALERAIEEREGKTC